MSTRHLYTMLNPTSVAVIGASPRPESIGAVVWRNLRAGSFKGPVYAVNPKYRRLDGQIVFASADKLPQAPDLAVICTPEHAVAEIVTTLAERGTRAVIVLSAMPDEAQRLAMLDAARPHLLRVLGPGCIGLLAPHIGLNASIAPTGAMPGDLAFVTQSGALSSAMLDWAQARGIGFAHVVSLGQRADVDAADLLDHLASDARTRAILLHFESTVVPRKFMSAARAAARNKPVIVVRAGQSAETERPGTDRVYDAALARAGMLRVATLQQMFLAAETLARFRANRSERLCILTNGSGAGVLAADAAARIGVRLCELDAGTLQRLQPLLVRAPAQAAPLLLYAQAPAERYAQAVQALHDDPSEPAVLVIHAPTAGVASAQIARALLPLAQQTPPRLLGCWLGASAVAEAQAVFQESGIASFQTPEDAVHAFSMRVAYRHNQAQLIEAPPSISLDITPEAASSARALTQRALGQGRTRLDLEETRTLLGLYGIETVAAQQVELEPYAAASAAEKIGFPVWLQIRSPDISPDVDAGAQRQDLRTAVQVRDAARRMIGLLRRRLPEARLDGFCVQSMALSAHARELSVGARIDPLFGPVIGLGQGCTPIDASGELQVALPPLNVPLASALVRRSGAHWSLRRQGDTPAADEAALHRVLVGVSQLLSDVSLLAELDLCPVLVSPDGAVALHARVQLSVQAPAGALNFAIRPYPSNLVETLDWRGRRLTLRPIRPEDEAQHMAFLSQLDPNDIRMRVFYSRRSIERSELARLTQIDYAREMAFVAVDAGPDGQERTLGVVRAIADPDNVSAEFGIVIRSDMKGEGLGGLLMRRIIDYQRSHGTQKLVATVLAENTRMLELAHRLGFVEVPSPDGDGTRGIELVL